MTEHILILGAGRSSAALIGYLAVICGERGWRLTVGDIDEAAAARVTAGFPNARPMRFVLSDESQAEAAIMDASMVVSLLPPSLHPAIAAYCLKYRKHLLTASYVQEAMQAFDRDARDSGLIFLNECGLDPGLDHMSAAEVFDRIRNQGGRITGFRSFTGGLIAPETEPDNHWRYKFTWNSRNVVTAGQGVATYLDGGKVRRIPYSQLFRRLFAIHIEGLGNLDGYANRDSLKYRSLYGLDDVSTLLRGTLRFRGFCQSWHILAQLGCCDDQQPIERPGELTHAAFIDMFLPPGAGTVRQRLGKWQGLAEDSHELDLLEEAGLFLDEPTGIGQGTAAAVLEHILIKRWKLKPGDKDLVVMWHQFIYELEGREQEIHASLICTGQDDVDTAMARTVGLPLGIAARLIGEKAVKSTGVCIPTDAVWYVPVLRELRTLGIELHEKQVR